MENNSRTPDRSGIRTWLQQSYDSLPDILQRAIGWIPALMNWLIVLAALYAVIFILQFVGLAPDLTREARLEFDPGNQSIDRSTNVVWRILQGRTRPNTLVEISINDRKVKTLRTNAFGRFRTSLPLPVFAYSVTVRTQGNGRGELIDEQVLSVYWDDPGAFSPTLDLAFVNREEGWLWVAGTATPGSSVEIRSPQGQYQNYLTSNLLGVFDAILPLEEELGDELVASVFGSYDVLETSPLKIERIDEATFPLERTVVANFSSTEQTIQSKIALPEAHPYYLGLGQGFITPNQFVQLTVGEFFADDLLDLTHSMGIESGRGVVDIRGNWGGRISTFGLTGIGNGISRFPLLTAQDSVQVNFADMPLEKEPSPRPDSREENILIWKGPKAPEEFTSISIDFIAPAVSRPAPDRKTQMQSDYLERFESEEAPEFVRLTWRALVLLIPFAGLIWFARRDGYFSQEPWKPFLALVVILAIWRSWNYWYFLTIAGPSTWLQRLVTPIRFGLDLAGGEPEAELLANAGHNAFWIIFVAFVDLVGLYLTIIKNWDGSLPARKPGLITRRRKIFRYIYLGLISLLFVALFVLLRADKLEIFEFVGMVIETVGGESVSFDPYEQMYQWEDNLNRWLLDHLGSYQNGDSEFYIFLLRSELGWSLIAIILLALLLCAFGWQAGLFGIGLGFLGARAIVGSPDLVGPAWMMEELTGLVRTFDIIRRVVPWWLVVVVTGASAYPFVVKLLRSLIPPKNELSRKTYRFIAVVMVLVATRMLQGSQQVFLFVGGTLVMTAITWLIVTGLENFEPIRGWTERFQAWRIPIRLGVLGVAMLVAWPRPATGEQVRFRDMFSLFAQLDGVFVYIVALGIVLALVGYAKNKAENHLMVDRSMLPFAAFIFAAFLINSYTRWLFIPVAFVVALLLARFWLFRPERETQTLQSALKSAKANRNKLLKDIIDAQEANARFEKIRKALTKKLESGDIAPEEYEEKLASFEDYYKEELVFDRVDSNYLSRDIVFALGENSVSENTLLTLKYGAMLAILPIVISLYQYLPSSQVAFPYPLIDLITFIVPLAASWLLYAFFFGYFYVHIRGNTGLTKGLNMFMGIVVPFTVYRLLTTQSLADMQPFIIWGTQVFLFCTLLGLFVVDYRLIREHGYGFKNLLMIHNLPFLSVYASSVIAAVTPTVIGLLSDNVVEVFKFFLETVLPQVPSVGP